MPGSVEDDPPKQQPRWHAGAGRAAVKIAVAGLCAAAVVVVPGVLPALKGQQAAEVQAGGGVRQLQAGEAVPEEACSENGRWQGLPWVYLTYAERNAWGELGWSEQWWDIAWDANSGAVRTATGRCFGGSYVIGESGMDSCLEGEVVQTYDECMNASLQYQQAYPGDLFPLGSPVDDLQGTPACHIQDRVGWQFNLAQITGRNQGYSPVCKFNATEIGGCPQTTTTTGSPLPNGLDFADTIPLPLITCYGDLTRDQQDAVRLLGYSIDAWHACMDPTWNPPICAWPDSIPKPSAPCLERLDYLDGKYNLTEPWMELTFRAKEALVDLGWDPDGARWSIMDIPETYAKPFEGQPPPTGLSKNEREAADFLGYTADTWHGCESESECIDRLARFETKLLHYTWDSMPEGVRSRLETLGWTAEFWFEGEPPALYRTKWDDLRFPERVSATLLGYTRDTWEGCVMSACLARYNYVLEKYDGKTWGDMKMAQQNAWTQLEHSEALWNEGGMMRTRTFSMRWAELSPAQQRQATFLGFNEGSWQGCNLEWGSGLNESTAPAVFGGPYRTVRVQMVIESPFSEISGNVYGQKVSAMPTSFIEVFERSVARALFCGNPDYKNYTAGAVDTEGNPLCKLPDEFEKQRRRVRVVSVLEGSIIVDFIIVANQTAHEETAAELYSALSAQLETLESPICQDVEFGHFARVAKIEEVPLSKLDPEERERAMTFEGMRGAYSAANACELLADARDGKVKCPTAGARRLRPSAVAGAALFLAAAAVLPGPGGSPGLSFPWQP